jgi:hypothetical protein
MGVLLAAAGCTVSRQGTLETLPFGAVIPVTVSVEGDAVAVQGQHPETGESFEGRLAKVGPARSASDHWYQSPGGTGAPMPSGIGATGSGDNERTIDVAGNLEGDKGTTLHCVVQVERRVRLAGSGLCTVVGAVEGAPTFRLKF